MATYTSAMISTWDKISNQLKDRLNEGVFQVWIRPLKADLTDRGLTLLAPSDFAVSWVRERLLDDILQAVRDVLGHSVTIEIRKEPGSVAAPELPKPAPESPTPRPSQTTVATQLGLALDDTPVQFVERTRQWRFAFEDFVVGPCNELAFAAAQSICGDSLVADNVFLTSAPGLGKTHLMHAVGTRMCGTANRAARVAYLTAEEFATQMVMALKARDMERFKARYRESVDVLLLEDIHFLQGKEKIQDEVLSTIKCLQNAGRKVVFTSSFLPKELQDVDSQLTSRFCSGFLVRIEKPEIETKRRILTLKARKLNAYMPEDVADLLAQSIDSDIRQLESCLQNMVLKASLLRRSINMELAMQVLQNYTLDTPSMSMESILRFICRSFDISDEELRSKTRRHQAVLARNTAFYLARKHTGLSLAAIGEPLNRKHSTVLKGITNIERELSAHTPLAAQITRVIERLQ